MSVSILEKNKGLKNFIIISGLLGIPLLAAFLKDEYAMWITLFFILSSILWILIGRSTRDNSDFPIMMRWCIVAFTLRVGIVVTATIFPSLTLPSDALGYETKGLEIAQNWHSGNLSSELFTQQFLYYISNAITYYLFGFYPSLMRIFNSFLGVCAGINVYIVAKKVGGDKNGKIAAFMMLFFPSFIIWQTMNLKEALVIFLLTLIIKNLLIIKESCKIRYLVLCIIYTSLLTVTRSYLGIMMAGIIVLFYFYIGKLSTGKKVLIGTIIFSIIGVITYKAGMGLFGMQYIKSFNLASIDATRKSDYRGGSQILQNLSMATPTDLIKFLPVAMVYFIFSPFPWQVSGSFVQFFGAVENIFWYIIFIAFIPGTFMIYKKDKVTAGLMLVILLPLTLFYSATMGNMGLSYRMRGQLLPMFFIIASFGFVDFIKRCERKFGEAEGI